MGEIPGDGDDQFEISRKLADALLKRENQYLDSPKAQRHDYVNEVVWFSSVITPETRALSPREFCNMLKKHLDQADRVNVMPTFSEKFPDHKGQNKFFVDAVDKLARLINQHFTKNTLDAKKLEDNAEKIRRLCYL